MKKSVKKSDFNWKKILIIFLVIFGIILVFTLIDYLFHQLSPDYSVPSYYFRNKIIFGTLIGLICYFFIRKLNVFKKALVFSLIIVILLQIRYYIEGYSKYFVFLFLGIHFVILLIVSFAGFNIFKKWI